MFRRSYIDKTLLDLKGMIVLIIDHRVRLTYVVFFSFDSITSIIFNYNRVTRKR